VNYEFFKFPIYHKNIPSHPKVNEHLKVLLDYVSSQKEKKLEMKII